MVRRIASQVHKQAARLMRANYIQQEPAWFQAVLEHPPIPLPPKVPAPRTSFDMHQSVKSHTQKYNPRDPRPLPITYLEDDVRRQFFRDHPFEAFRPISIVEGAAIQSQHPIQGAAWTRLSQRGRNPMPEDAVQFTVNLHQNCGLPLTKAYSVAIAQFRSLRSEHYVSSTFAMLEAEAYGAEFGPTLNEEIFEEERKGIESYRTPEEMDEGAMAARKKWKAIVERKSNLGEWSRGQEYVRLWKEGFRPDWSPALTEPIITPDGLSPDNAADFLNLRPQ